jgi:hypothetical protein
LRFSLPKTQRPGTSNDVKTIQMGIHHIWVVDPQTRAGYDCSNGSWIETNFLAAENSPIAVDLSVIFADLD